MLVYLIMYIYTFNYVQIKKLFVEKIRKNVLIKLIRNSFINLINQTEI